jgi:hypothetical protein
MDDVEEVVDDFYEEGDDKETETFEEISEPDDEDGDAVEEGTEDEVFSDEE